MPQTPDGVCRLARELDNVDERVEPPLLVWWWDVDAGEQRRGVLYGWQRVNGQRLALIVARGAGDACTVGARDCVRWVAAHLTRERSDLSE